MGSGTGFAKHRFRLGTTCLWPDAEIKKPAALGKRPLRFPTAFLSRAIVPLRRFLRHHIFSSLTRRILFLAIGLALGVAGQALASWTLLDLSPTWDIEAVGTRFGRPGRGTRGSPPSPTRCS